MEDFDSDALQRILGDMDEMESKRLFGTKDPEDAKGVTITIAVEPQGATGEDGDKGTCPQCGKPMAMCKGGCAMADGGKVPDFKTGESEPEELYLPPFLRKKKSKIG